MANSLFSPIPDMKKEVGFDATPFLCMLEGWKTKVKNLHWAAPKMNVHKLCDEISEFTDEYEDSLAEDFMGIQGKVQPNILKGTPCDCLNVKDLLSSMLAHTKVFYASIPADIEYVGIKSETETFIHNINKYIYLAGLCDVSLY